MENISEILDSILNLIRKEMDKHGLRGVSSLLDESQEGVPIVVTIEKTKPSFTIWLNKRVTDEFLSFLKNYADISRDDIQDVNIIISENSISVEVTVRVEEFCPKETPESIITTDEEAIVIFTPVRGLVITFLLRH